jgi:hypothetical protein
MCVLAQAVRDLSLLSNLFDVRFLTIVYGENLNGRRKTILCTQ